MRELVKRLNVTTLFVTHEQIEALTMSDLVAVMKDGNIVQAGTPLEIYARPRNLFVAEFIGRTNLLRGRIGGAAPSNVMSACPVETPVATLSCRVQSSMPAGAQVVVAVRPEDIRLVRPDDAEATGNTVSGQVERLSFLGETVDCFVRIGDSSLMLRLHPGHAPQTGETISLHLPPASCLAMPDPDGKAAVAPQHH